MATVDKCAEAIKALAEHKGSSRQAIVKYFKNELKLDNAQAVAKALKDGVAKGVLTQIGQSFKVKGVEFAEKAEDRVDVERLAPPKDESSAPAKKGDTVHVAYVGTLLDGTKFDSADEFSFELGAGDVIKGWDKGFQGLRVGERVKLTIPSKLGYGKRGSPPEIPPDATLVFDVTMKRIS